MYIKVFSYCSCIVEVLIDKEDFKGRSLSLAPARREPTEKVRQMDKFTKTTRIIRI